MQKRAVPLPLLTGATTKGSNEGIAPMSFDIHAFALHKSTKAEAIQYLRRLSESGEPASLSPLALAEISDQMDPQVDRRGQRKKTINEEALANAAGQMKAINTFARFDYLTIFKKTTQAEFKRDHYKPTWRDVICEVRGVSHSALNRALASEGGRLAFNDSYVDMAISFWAYGAIEAFQPLPGTPKESLKARVLIAMQSKSITQKQCLRLLKHFNIE